MTRTTDTDRQTDSLLNRFRADCGPWTKRLLTFTSVLAFTAAVVVHVWMELPARLGPTLATSDVVALYVALGAVPLALRAAADGFFGWVGLHGSRLVERVPGPSAVGGRPVLAVVAVVVLVVLSASVAPFAGSALAALPADKVGSVATVQSDGLVYQGGSTVSAVEADTGNEIWTFQPPSSAVEVSLSPDGSKVFYDGPVDGIVGALDADTGEEL